MFRPRQFRITSLDYYSAIRGSIVLFFFAIKIPTLDGWIFLFILIMMMAWTGSERLLKLLYFLGFLKF